MSEPYRTDPHPTEPHRAEPRSFEPRGTGAHPDEISLRDLYLILKAGLPFVLVFALVSGLAAFALVRVQPASYQAQATTLVTPPPVRFQETTGITLAPGTDVTYETYQTLATSRPVLERALELAPDAGVTPEGLRSMGTLSRLIGPQRPEQPSALAVTHTVRAGDPALAVQLADSWAEATLETVRESLLTNLGPVAEATRAEREALQASLGAAEEALERQRAESVRVELTNRAEFLAESIALAESGLVVLPAAGAGLDDGTLIAPRVNLELEIAAQEATVTSLRSNGAVPAATVAEHEARLAGLQARRDALEGQLVTLRAEQADVRARLAQAERLEREADRVFAEARVAYERIAALQPSIEYFGQLTPVNARLLSSASVPESPAGASVRLIAILAALGGGMLAVLLVFLRAAVAPPPPVPAGAPRERRMPATD